MCGLCGIVLREDSRWDSDLELMLDRALVDIASRGWDATGIAAITRGGHIFIEKGAMPARTFIKERRALPLDTVAVIAHTRAATQGHYGFDRNNHPLRLGPITLAHNGWVNNERELRAKAEAAGVVGIAEVDTEAAVVMLKAHPKETLLRKLDGAAALTWHDSRDNSIRLSVKTPGSTPLIVADTGFGISWGSYESAARSLQAGNPVRKRSIKRLDAGDGFRITLSPRVTANRFRFAVEWPTPKYQVTSRWNSGAWENSYQAWLEDKEAERAATDSYWDGRNLSLPYSPEEIDSGDACSIDAYYSRKRCDLCNEIGIEGSLYSMNLCGECMAEAQTWTVEEAEWTSALIEDEPANGR